MRKTQLFLPVLLMIVLVGSISAPLVARPMDEGMWLLLQLQGRKYKDMQKMGLKLKPEDIYSINHSSLKDAIPSFNGGCTSELVSPEGLLLTNHHCGYGLIQNHSTKEHNYLKNGFWAQSREDELPNPDAKASFLVRIEDVTERIEKAAEEAENYPARQQKIRQEISKIQKEAVEGTHYNAEVKSFYGGNEYYLFVNETFRDVRLVGTPPKSIGKYGGDTDNWMWPRHTGDFSMFRIYTGPDGKPADYSEDNVPLQSKHYLPVSTKGVKEHDFAMIMGFPGGTKRYLNSRGVKQELTLKQPYHVALRKEKLDIMKKYMKKDEKIDLMYSSKYAGISNYYKYFKGQMRGIKRLNVYQKKKDLENKFLDWAQQNDQRASQYGDAIKLLDQAYQGLNKYAKPKTYFLEAVWTGPEILKFSYQFSGLKKALKKEEPEPEKIRKLVEKLRPKAQEHFKEYYQPIDKELFATMMKRYYQDLPKEHLPEYFIEEVKSYDEDFQAMAEDYFQESIFAKQERLMAFLAKIEDGQLPGMGFLKKRKTKPLTEDPALKLLSKLRSAYIQKVAAASKPYKQKKKQGRKKFIAGLRKMNPDKVYYPNANFTMRVTYGQVMPYQAADAVFYDYYTTLKGVMEKADSTDDEFRVPPKLKTLYQQKDYGPYGENGELRVNFIANLDITGGNSGSPVLNGQGELIGLAFDGNWEAMSGDIAFEPDLQRTICVDIRYVLFCIDQFAGADHLVEEMTLAKK